MNKYHDYLKTDYWKAVAGAVKAKAKFKCQVCNSPHDLDAHHRTYEHRGNELNHLEDLICLCRRCHGIFHGKIPQSEPPGQPTTKKVSNNKKRNRPEKVDHAQVELDMSTIEGEKIILTKQLLTMLRTGRHGFTNATIRVLKIDSFSRGWVTRLVGKELSRGEFRKAMEGRYEYNTGILEAKDFSLNEVNHTTNQ